MSGTVPDQNEDKEAAKAEADEKLPEQFENICQKIYFNWELPATSDKR